MVEATDFNSALRDNAVGVSVPAGTVVEAPDAPADFSFDFSRSDIRTFEREGDDLIIILENGQVARINNYYESVYENALVFQDENEAVVATSGLILPIGGLVAAGGAAALVGGGGGSGGGGGPSIVISDDNGGADGVVSAAETAGGLTITGTSTPNVDVEVSMGGTTQSTTADAAGNWSVTFPPSDVPSGEQDVLVNAVATDAGGAQASDNATITFDTIVNELSVTDLPGGADEVVNGAEAADGVTVTGTVEPGSTVVVDFNGEEYDATVGADGTWSLDIPAADIPEGDGETHTLEVTATDAAGNVDTITETFEIDTTVSVLTLDEVPGGADEVVNAEEAEDGLTVEGTVEPGSTVSIVFEGVEYPASVDAGGNWSADIPASAVPDSDGGTFTIDVTATDAAGNTATTSGDFVIDTGVSTLTLDQMPGGDDGVVNADEAGEDLTVGGTVEPGSSVVVIFDGVEYPADVTDGTWTAEIPAEDLPDSNGGEFTIIVEATDEAGNPASVSDTFVIDTLIDELTVDDTDPGGDDGVVNADEAEDGITLTGTVDPGSTVVVVIGDTEHEAVVDDDGDWIAEIPGSSIPDGNGDDIEIVITATDEAGNTDTVTETITVDTTAPEVPLVSNIASGRGEGATSFVIPTIDDGTPSFFTTTSGGGVSTVDIAENTTTMPNGETQYNLDSGVIADLILSVADDAGNVESTYTIFDSGSANTDTFLSNPALGELNISTIDLGHEDVHLVLNESDVVNLSEDTDTLIVYGDDDDTVTLTNASSNGTVIDDDGNRFTEYTMGDATVWVDQNIDPSNVTVV